MKRFLKNLWMGFYLLINPKYLSKKVAEINSSIDENTALNIVSKSVIKELEKFAVHHPNDIGLKARIELMKTYDIESKEDVKDMIREKQEILEREVKHCSKCHSSYVFYCKDQKEAEE